MTLRLGSERTKIAPYVVVRTSTDEGDSLPLPGEDEPKSQADTHSPYAGRMHFSEADPRMGVRLAEHL